MKKVMILVLMMVGMSGCQTFTGVKDVDPEAVLPVEVDVVVAVDFTNSDQVKIFKELVARFPDMGFKDEFVRGFDNEMEEGMSYEESFKPILDGEWKIVFGMDFDDEMSMRDLEYFNEDKIDIYVAGEFSEADKVQALFEQIADNEEEILDYEKKDGGVEYWTNEEEEFYLARYGDVFWLTNKVENREAGWGRIENENGLGEDDEFLAGIKGVGDENLMYVYVGGAFMKMIGQGSEYLDAFGDVFMSGKAEKKGIRMVSRANMDGDEDYLEDLLGLDYKLELIDKVPADGIFLYMEMANLMQIFESMSMQKDMMEDMYGAMPDVKKEVKDFVVGVTDLTEEEVEAFMGSPYAIAMSDVGEFYPTLSFYIYIDDEFMSAAKELAASLDDYADEVIFAFDKEVGDYGYAGLLKKDVVLLEGEPIHKIYVDWVAMDKEILAEFSTMTGMDLSEMVVELYYGVTGDNVFLMSLYPGFEEFYGKNVLANDDSYEEALKNLNVSTDNMVEFIRVEPVLKIADRYVELLKSMGVLRQGDVADYNNVRDFIAVFEYLIAGGEYDDGVMKSESFMKIGGEVEVE